MFSPVRVPIGLVRAAEYMRDHGDSQDVFQDSQFDRTCAVAALAERSTYAARTLTIMSYNGDLLQQTNRLHRTLHGASRRRRGRRDRAPDRPSLVPARPGRPDRLAGRDRPSGRHSSWTDTAFIASEAPRAAAMNKPIVEAREVRSRPGAAGARSPCSAIGLADISYAQKLFVHTTYFFLMATVLCWAGTYLHAARDVRRETIVAWAKENWPGLVIALAVTVVAWLAIHPALRILSDEANLVGTSKNLFASRTATFTVSGKNYYDSYWDVDVAIDRRPALFPFLVSLVHVVRGYSYKNVFLFNLLLLPAFVLVSYRLAKSLGGETSGETFGVVASLLVVAHPITLIAVRSGGFDFLALFFSLLVIKSLLDHVREPSAATAGDPLDEPVHVRRDPLRERAVHRAGGGAAARLPAGQLEPPASLRVHLCADAGVSRAPDLAGRAARERAGAGTRGDRLQPRELLQQRPRVLQARPVTLE